MKAIIARLKNKIKNLTIAEYTLLVGIFLIVLIPPILVKFTGLISFFKDSAELGDAIGGITAPLSSILGSILVFLALKSQIEANKLIKEQFDDQKFIQYYTEQINQIIYDINNFQYDHYLDSEIPNSSPDNKKVSYNSTLAIYVLIIKYHDGKYEKFKSIEDESKFYEILNFLDRLRHISGYIFKSKINDVEKQFLKSQIVYIYNSKIRYSYKLFTNDFISNGNLDNVPHDIFNNFEYLEKLI